MHKIFKGEEEEEELKHDRVGSLIPREDEEE
jgi:hypothetical protein